MNASPQLPPRRYINRELSWVEFNARVLSEGLNRQNPLLERLKFLSIVSSNFDEFFMVRVASLKRQMQLDEGVTCPSGLAPDEVWRRVLRRVRETVVAQYQCLHAEVLPGLSTAGIQLVLPTACDTDQQNYLLDRFDREIFPTLTPLAVQEDKPLPFTGNLRTHLFFRLRMTNLPDAQPKLALVQLPHSLNRLQRLPHTDDGITRLVLLEDIILAHAPKLFPGYDVLEHALFRVTRDADLSVDEERDEDFLAAMAEVVTDREHTQPVRLELCTASKFLKLFLCKALGVKKAELYENEGPIDLKAFMGLLALPGFEAQRDVPWPAQPPRDLPPEARLWDVLRTRDILLHHPYETFDPVVRLVSEAAVDPDVLAIKMTLYRTSGRSPIVRALSLAAENGKQVTALVELKARFDEERNIEWARRLERTGVIVIYGIARLKVHAKAIMVVRREPDGIRRYVHVGTGNYNDSTAKLYTDMGLMSSREDLTLEVTRFFNVITGYSASPGLRLLVMAPNGLRARFLQLIDREVQLHTRDNPSQIRAKMNSLVDPAIIAALYRASQAGVPIHLNVRGICCLQPGVPGLSENIRVVSIIDRFLEHSRIFCFHHGGDTEVYLASADWMPRNLDQRVELMFPISNKDLRDRVLKAMDRFFADNTHAHELQSDGTYLRPVVPAGTPLVAAQESFYRDAVKAARQASSRPTRDFSVRRASRLGRKVEKPDKPEKPEKSG